MGRLRSVSTRKPIDVILITYTLGKKKTFSAFKSNSVIFGKYFAVFIILL